MVPVERYEEKKKRYVVEGNHRDSDYLGLITEIAKDSSLEAAEKQQMLADAYRLLAAELQENSGDPVVPISFGTSGWRGRLGKDFFARSVALVTRAIVLMYESVDGDSAMAELLGVKSLSEARRMGCVLGFDNRFGGEFLACQVARVLTENGFFVHYAGESTTGVLSAAVLVKGAAFSINLTPSHNPLEYAGYKFNAADAGPAASEVTARITANAAKLCDEKYVYRPIPSCTVREVLEMEAVSAFNSLNDWKELVRRNRAVHGLDLDASVAGFLEREDIAVVIDCVHGASRLHIRELFGATENPGLALLRDNADVTFGGVAPEPSTANMQGVVAALGDRTEKFKLGAIIDPDGDRIRFTDGTTEISMNQFGAMAYHFLHEYKGKKGVVAKTVATSNLANSLADKFHEETFEPKVGFKNFKPVIGRALVCFEESDGISIIGHTPEKDAYIGLLLALEMLLVTGKNLGEYLAGIEDEFGSFYPERDGVEVSLSGEPLLAKLAGLARYGEGRTLQVGETSRKIVEVISIDGRKIIFEDGSWLMIRPSGTEPKVRFYVESRTPAGTTDLVDAAKRLLREIGLI